MRMRKIKDRIMKIKSWKSVVVLVVGLLIGIFLDAIVSVTGWYFIGVGEDYSNEVFGAICTVAVLGNAILSLLFGSSDKLIRGIPIQDILGSPLPATSSAPPFTRPAAAPTSWWK